MGTKAHDHSPLSRLGAGRLRGGLCLRFFLSRKHFQEMP